MSSDVRRAIPIAMGACAVTVSAYFVARGFADLALVRLIAAKSDVAARPPSAVTHAPVHSSPSPAVPSILGRDAVGSKAGALQPPPPPVVTKGADTPPEAPPEAGPCDEALRVSGAAYVAPERGRPIVVFSGPDVRHSGARSVGMSVADLTVTAIYPNVVVLTDAKGQPCWVKMRGAHAFEVAKTERRQEARLRMKQHREATKRNAKLRAEARAKKRAKQPKR